MPKVELKGKLVQVGDMWVPGGNVVEVSDAEAKRLVDLHAAEKVDGRRSATTDGK